jgi:hypothetical protein
MKTSCFIDSYRRAAPFKGVGPPVREDRGRSPLVIPINKGNRKNPTTQVWSLFLSILIRISMAKGFSWWPRLLEFWIFFKWFLRIFALVFLALFRCHENILVLKERLEIVRFSFTFSEGLFDEFAVFFFVGEF